MKLSCPECLASFEYFLPPNAKVILVRVFSSWIVDNSEQKANKLSSILKTPVLYTFVRCAKCGKKISVFYILEEKKLDDFHIDIDDHSTEI